MDTRPAPRSNALRTGRRSQAGRRYLITTVCLDRERRFAEWECASRVASAIDDPRLWRDSRLLCWTLMPDHLHLMIELGHTESLASLMCRVKCVTAGVANAIAHRRGPVWMRGYHDHALRRDESAIAASRYLILNPVRAGIVVRAGDYPYWNCAWLEPGMAD
ncbi:MAG: REP-associated tyrosine transposase [Pseudomonadota bacterium]